MIFIEKQPALCYNKKDNPDDSFLRKEVNETNLNC